MLPQRSVQVCQLTFVVAAEIGDEQIVEVRRIVHGVREPTCLVADVDQVHRSLAGRDRRDVPGGDVHAIQVRGALDAGLEIQRLARFSPPQRRRNQIERLGGQTRRRTAGCRREPDSRVRAFWNRAQKRDRLAIRRPARRAVGLRVIRDLRQRSTGRVDHPHVGVAALIERLAGAIGHERDLLAVG